MSSMPRIQIGPFSLTTPQGWTLSTVILAGPVSEPPPVRGRFDLKEERRFQRNVVATMEQVAPNDTVESYVRRQIDGLREAGVEREEEKRERVRLDSGLEGLMTEQVVTGQQGERVHQMQLVCIKEGVAHTIIASDLDGERFEGARDEFRAILLSFA